MQANLLLNFMNMRKQNNHTIFFYVVQQCYCPTPFNQHIILNKNLNVYDQHWLMDAIKADPWAKDNLYHCYLRQRLCDS